MSYRFPPLGVLVPVLLGHVLLTALVWRDIDRRDRSDLRGGKLLWRTLTALNTGNSVIYLLVGRRRASSA
jgi:hypothetical protein